MSRRDVSKGDYVPNAPLRAEVIRSETNPSELAAWIGWERVLRGRIAPDTTRVLRSLGMKASDGHYQSTLNYDTAVLMALALGLDPYEAGV